MREGFDCASTGGPYLTPEDNASPWPTSTAGAAGAADVSALVNRYARYTHTLL